MSTETNHEDLPAPAITPEERRRARLAELSEPLPTGVPGQYEGWPAMLDMDTQVAQAMAALEVLLRKAQRHKSAVYRSRLAMSIDRALADPEAGYLRRLRMVRSEALRERAAAGESDAQIAQSLNLSRNRIWTLIHNNRTYVSFEREQVLEELAAERAASTAARRANRKRDRTADLAARAEQRRLERVALGRPLLARLAAGETRESLLVELGWSRQRLATVLADAARAVEAEAVTGGVVADGAHDEPETAAPLAA